MRPIRTHLTLFLTLVLFTSVSAQERGKVMTDLKMNSTKLGMDRNYAVYLPPGYEEDRREYPVLYLLHGYSDNYTGWSYWRESLPLVLRFISDGFHQN